MTARICRRAFCFTKVEKQGFFGKRKVLEDRVIEVDEATYRKMKRQQKNRPFSLGEMIIYDEVFDEWDD